jgi:hypothetical protein
MRHMPHFLVFTSYAPGRPREIFGKVVGEFREELGSLLGQADCTTVGFFDRGGVNADDAWNETIFDAVRHAKVLICLCRPRVTERMV